MLRENILSDNLIEKEMKQEINQDIKIEDLDDEQE